MKLILRIIVSLVFALASMPAAHAARSAQPMELFLNNPITTLSGAKPSVDQIETAMIRAGLQREWVITRNADGTLNGHLDVRGGKHTLDVVITLHGDQYDIAYKNSTNLEYAPNPADPAHPLIHPSYNKWMKTLIKDFSVQFGNL